MRIASTSERDQGGSVPPRAARRSRHTRPRAVRASAASQRHHTPLRRSMPSRSSTAMPSRATSAASAIHPRGADRRPARFTTARATSSASSCSSSAICRARGQLRDVRRRPRPNPARDRRPGCFVRGLLIDPGTERLAGDLDRLARVALPTAVAPPASIRICEYPLRDRGRRHRVGPPPSGSSAIARSYAAIAPRPSASIQR